MLIESVVGVQYVAELDHFGGFRFAWGVPSERRAAASTSIIFSLSVAVHYNLPATRGVCWAWKADGKLVGIVPTCRIAVTRG